MKLAQLEKQRKSLIKKGNVLIALAIKHTRASKACWHKLGPIMNKRFKLDKQIKKLKKANKNGK